MQADKPRITAGMFTSRTDEWATPSDFFAMLDAEFHFDLDPCCTHENAKCKKHYTLKDNGLMQNWGGQRVFCNPPYGRAIKDWMRKCAEESRKSDTLVVALVPARTDTAWFHDYVYKKAREIRFIRGRLRFNDARDSAPFPSMIIVF